MNTINIALALVARTNDLAALRQMRFNAAKRDAQPVVDAIDAKIATVAAPPKHLVGGLSIHAMELLYGLFVAAPDGEWTNQAPLARHIEPQRRGGFWNALGQYGLVELRHDGGDKFSARITEAGVVAAI